MSDARKARRAVALRERGPGRGPKNPGLGGLIVGLTLAAMIAAAIASGQTAPDRPEPGALPLPTPPAVEGNPVLSAPAPAGPKAPSLRSRLRSIVSHMPAEEAPGPAPGEAGTALAESGAPLAEPRPAALGREVAPTPPGPPSLTSGKPPSAGGQVRIPIGTAKDAEAVQIQESGGLISLSARDAPLSRVLMLLGQQLKVNIVCPNTVSTPISVTLDRVPLADAMTSICSVAGCTWAHSNGIVQVTSVASSSKLPAEVQGRQLRVLRLDYASATDVESAVKGMLSPVGSSYVSRTMPTDNRKTEEVVVVQDLPSYVQGIEDYVRQVDRPPRQVMIETHVLEVRLAADCNWGVNFSYLFGRSHLVKFQAKGFADATAPQAFFFSFDGTDLDALLQALRTQTQAKSLASPKVLVLNGQEARIQIGKRSGFLVTTTTETSTMQSVNFLDTGVVLRVVPRVTRDGQVLMQVKPEVSDGGIKENGLPEEVTTHVESSVMLPDGRGMVIGGLIKEDAKDEQQKIPWLGDLWLVGKLFQRQAITKERREIIITLLPRIVPDCMADDDRHALEVQRAATPVLCGPLMPAPRPWEAQLPDAINNPWCPRGCDLVWTPGVAAPAGCPPDGPQGGALPEEPYYQRERRAESCPPELPSGPAPAGIQGAREYLRR
jgi:hypothetical protein